MINTFFGFHPSFVMLVLRLVIGIIFIAHGYTKLFKAPGPQGTAGYLKSLNIPAPLLFAYVVGIVEFFGGIFLVLGLFTRYAGIAIAVNMLVAMSKVKFRTGLVTKVMQGGWAGGFELDLSLFSIALAMIFLGGGKFSVDFTLLNQW